MAVWNETTAIRVVCAHRHAYWHCAEPGRIRKMNLEGANSGGVPSGVQGRPPEADDFSQLKGYLDVTSGILGGGHGPLAILKSASARSSVYVAARCPSVRA